MSIIANSFFFVKHRLVADIFFPFLLEFGHPLLTYSFYNKVRIVDKPLTISPLIKRWRYTFVYRHLCFY